MENPDLDARNKVAKAIPTTMSALIGRWKADSTYTVFDSRAEQLTSASVWMEVFADTSYSQIDTTKLAFNGKSDGVYYLSGDTLITFPSAAPPDTFMVRLSFAGNYLQLTRSSDQRLTFFHKIKPWDSVTQITMLKDSIWRMEGRRLDPGIFRPEPQVRNFSYLHFSGDSMFSDVRVNGVVRTDSGLLVKRGFTWTWKATKGDLAYLADLVQDDSLRMWPLTEGRPDSGYFLYSRNLSTHFHDIDMRKLLGHMRCDSIRFTSGIVENHYGRYYDWTFSEDHKIFVETNMNDMARFNAWSLDSGLLILDAPGFPRTRVQVTADSGKAVLTAIEAGAFRSGENIFQTKVDPSRFPEHPLERFDRASYLQLVVSGDTAEYFHNENYSKESFEIARRISESQYYWASIILNKNLETYQSGQPGFYFAFEGRTATLGAFQCRSRPNRDLVIRSTVSGDPILAQGLIQGACQILKADSAFTDSTLNLEGAFRLRRKNMGSMFSTAWGFP
ncbi:MAG: hypothetical protein ABIQ80_22685 [Fibrobacteria bacterium]